jgi:hypothetical protein
LGQNLPASLSEVADGLLCPILDPQEGGLFVENHRQSLQCFNFGAQLKRAQSDSFEIRQLFNLA